MSRLQAAAVIARLDALQQADEVDPAATAKVLAELRELKPKQLAQALGVDRGPDDPEQDADEGLESIVPGPWSNWPRNFFSRRVDVKRPRKLKRLIKIVQKAVDQGKKVKPVGSRYSCSRAPVPADDSIAIDIKHLDAVLPINDNRIGVNGADYARVEAGIQLRKLAPALDERGKALANMGGFAKQTLAGVMSTGTHGTGLRQSTFCDMVASVDLVCIDRDGRAGLHRFEPSDGMTDPESFPDAATRLHQDDDMFHAMVVSFGTMGVVYAFTLRVVDRYFVREWHERFVFPHDFDRVLAQARAGQDLSIIINPNRTRRGGGWRGMVVHFDRKTRQDIGDLSMWQEPPVRKDDKAFLGFLSRTFGTRLLGALMERFKRLTQEEIEEFFHEQYDEEFTSVYYRTYPKTTGDRFRATYSELSVPIDELEDALTRVLEHTDAQDGRFLVPLAVRFVGASQHHLSMHQGRDSATIEAFMVNGMERPQQALRALEELLPGARPHWGQLFWMEDRTPAELYPDTWERWLTHYRRWNATGTFDSPITDQLDISMG